MTEYRQANTGVDCGTSIFDPVLCEILLRWFSAEGDKVFDPFAGGSVRGIVSNKLGRSYCGIELRGEQVEANKKQGAEICIGNEPEWICGDSANMDALIDAGRVFDFILTCPPYGDLERYSDNPADISNMDAADFDKVYSEILCKAVWRLSADRFAAVIVGNYRDKRGFMRDLVGLTVRSMESAGARFYNDAVLLTSISSAAIRAGGTFKATRKLCKTHQNVLIFCKGDPRKATERLGDVEVPDMAEYMDEGQT